MYIPFFINHMKCIKYYITSGFPILRFIMELNEIIQILNKSYQNNTY